MNIDVWILFILFVDVFQNEGIEFNLKGLTFSGFFAIINFVQIRVERKMLSCSMAFQCFKVILKFVVVENFQIGD